MHVTVHNLYTLLYIYSHKVTHTHTHSPPCVSPQRGWTHSSPGRCSCWWSSTARRRCCPAPAGWCLCSWSSRRRPSPSPCRSPRPSAAPGPGMTFRGAGQGSTVSLLFVVLALLLRCSPMLPLAAEEMLKNCAVVRIPLGKCDQQPQQIFCHI